MEYLGEFQIRHTIDNLQTISIINNEWLRLRGTYLFKEASSVIGPRWVCIRVHITDEGDYFILTRKKAVSSKMKTVQHDEFNALRLLPSEAYHTYIASLVGD